MIVPTALTVTLRRAPIQFQPTYRIDNIPLEGVHEMRDLGVVIGIKFNFSSHLLQNVSQANRVLGVPTRSFQTGVRAWSKINHRTLITTYFANVQSILECLQLRDLSGGGQIPH